MPIKSNKAVAEEFDRLTGYLRPAPKTDPAKHKPGCDNSQARYLDHPDAFRYNGRTPKGNNARYECRTCRASFTVGTKAILRQRTSHINKWFFKLLMNRVPFQRICELLEIDMSTLYHKIDFIHRQCMAFVGDREHRLLEGVDLVNGRKKPEKIYVSIDRQEYSVNWKTLEKDKAGEDDIDRRKVVLDALGSADVKTGYVFGMHVNFDGGMETDDVNNNKAKKNGDVNKLPGYREYARVWLEIDYQERRRSRRSRRREDPSFPIAGQIEEDYEDLRVREEDGDVESPELMPDDKKLPDRGMQVHEEYTMYAHFLYLKRIFSGIPKIRLFMDRETSIRAACHATFADEIKEGRFEGFFVKTNKLMTNPKKRAAYARAIAEFEKVRAANPGMKLWEVRLVMLRDRMANMMERGDFKDMYLRHPFPDMGEPEKEVCCLTDTGRYDVSEEERNHLAWLYGKASLHAINRFFMQLRRRVSLLERPLISAASSQRTWFGYSPYNPAMIQKLSDIFRVFYNYVKVTDPSPRKRKPKPYFDKNNLAPSGEDDLDVLMTVEAADARDAHGKKGKMPPTTPAMRFGLAKAPVRYEDIIYFCK